MPNDNLSIPAGAHELTESWLTSALRAAGILRTGHVIRFQSARIAEGIGLLGQLYRITLECAGAAPECPRQLVAKFPAASAENRALSEGFHFYQREINFYRYLPSWARLPIPRYYYGAIDDEGRQFVLLMEDLQAYEMGDQVRGANAKQVLAIVELAARMHAQFWGRLSETNPSWLIDPRAEFHAGLSHKLYTGSLPGVLRSFETRFSHASRAAAERLADYIPLFWEQISEPPITLLHGDLRLDNVMFGSELTRHRVAVLDFQIASSGRGPFDLGYFMSQSVPKEVRREVEKEALRRYHASLVAQGVRDYTLEACVRDYRRSIFCCLVYPVITCGVLDPNDERARAFGESFLERSLLAIEDTNAVAAT
jgi:hypothetical protein